MEGLFPFVCLLIFLWFISEIISTSGGGFPRFLKAVGFGLAGYYAAAILFSLERMRGIGDFFAIFISRPSDLRGPGVLAVLVGLFVLVVAFLVNPNLPTGMIDRVRRYPIRGHRRLSKPPASIARGRTMSAAQRKKGGLR